MGCCRAWLSVSLLGMLVAVERSEADRAGGGRFTYMADRDPYYPHTSFPKLTTPQWLAEPGVDAVILLSIDDMRDPEAYERYLRPLLNRLKEIDGRAPVSIFTCQVHPEQPRLAKFLAEGLSLEVHTVSHPCPLFRAPPGTAPGKESLRLVEEDYLGCIDNLARIGGNQPVAFRMPCCDSLNTNSPRFYSEIFPLRTPRGARLAASSSVFVLFNRKDPELKPEWVVDERGEDRFRKYIPFRNYGDFIENYPYPYVIDRLCWEFPAVVPTDWSAQNLWRPHNPGTVADWKLALDAAVAKQGIFCLVFHPHGWIKPEQLVELVDHAAQRYGTRVKFLNFREATGQLERNLLAGHPLRSPVGGDNGVRVLDVNADGFLDVVVANSRLRQTRVWRPETKDWSVSAFPVSLVEREETEEGKSLQAHFFNSPNTNFAAFLAPAASADGYRMWEFDGRDWGASALALPLGLDGLSNGPVDRGTRFRDVNGDGFDDLLLGGGAERSVHLWNVKGKQFQSAPFSLPVGIVDGLGADTGTRFVDLDADGDEDLVYANEREYGVWRYVDDQNGWRDQLRRGKAGTPASVPPMVYGGRPSGAWFFGRSLLMANEFTAKMPDFVEKRSFRELLTPIPAAPAR